MAINLWHHEEEQGYDKNKSTTAFTKWRVLVMERLGELNGQGNPKAVQTMHEYGLANLSLAYEDNITAEDLAQKLNSK